jgi:hypothetical protein
MHGCSIRTTVLSLSKDGWEERALAAWFDKLTTAGHRNQQY